MRQAFATHEVEQRKQRFEIQNRHAALIFSAAYFIDGYRPLERFSEETVSES